MRAKTVVSCMVAAVAGSVFLLGCGGGGTTNIEGQLQQIAISPDVVTLQTGESQQFSLTAEWSDGDTRIPPVTYSVVGPGGITASTGNYTAPNSAGSALVVVAPQGSTLRDTAQVTIEAVPPPPPPSAFTANEPAGMTRHATIDFSTGGANFETGPFGSSVGFNDATAPFTGPSTARFVYPAGPAAGYFTGAYRPAEFPAGTVRVYVAFNWRLSSNFTLNPANLKGWYFYRNANIIGGSIVLGWNPTGGSLSTGSFELNGQPQTNAGPGLMGHNQPGAPTLVRNRWYHTEMLVVMNSSPSVSDGIFRVWVDGVLTINNTNVRFSEGSQPLEWRSANLDPYYGGDTPGHTIPATSYLFVDHAIVSRSSTRN